MPSLRHIAIVVRDLDAMTEFYKSVFELEYVGSETIGTGTANYLTDGVVNLALLYFSDKTGEELDRMAGLNHFGIQVDDVAEYERRASCSTFPPTAGLAPPAASATTDASRPRTTAGGEFVRRAGCPTPGRVAPAAWRASCIPLGVA